jgi:hypothetical protein
MPDLVKGVASRPSAHWKYLTSGTSATLANTGTAAGKGDCPTCGGAKGWDSLHPHFNISTYRGGWQGRLSGRVCCPAGLSTTAPHDPEAAKFALARGARPDCLIALHGI